MRSSFSDELRRAARAALPEGAFLRRDRDEALFVTDAPRRAPDIDWPARFAEAGFLCTMDGGLAHLSPGPKWLAALEAAHPEPPDFFSASLRRFAGMEPGAEQLRLFAEGAKALETGAGTEAFDRRLRQRAAECLRNGIDGGGLYACALIRTIIEEERSS